MVHIRKYNGNYRRLPCNWTDSRDIITYARSLFAFSAIGDLCDGERQCFWVMVWISLFLGRSICRGVACLSSYSSIWAKKIPLLPKEEPEGKEINGMVRKARIWTIILITMLSIYAISCCQYRGGSFENKHLSVYASRNSWKNGDDFYDKLCWL